MPALAAELVREQVAVIVAVGGVLPPTRHSRLRSILVTRIGLIVSVRNPYFRSSRKTGCQGCSAVMGGFRSKRADRPRKILRFRSTSHRGEGGVPNPFSDFWDFLIGNTDDHNDLGSWKYLFVALFMGLIVASIAIAVRNWQEDRSQRTASHLATWFVRVLVGGMWFQGMLWKLPLPVSGGLRYWVEQMGNRAAFAPHRELVKEVYLPY